MADRGQQGPTGPQWQGQGPQWQGPRQQGPQWQGPRPPQVPGDGRQQGWLAPPPGWGAPPGYGPRGPYGYGPRADARVSPGVLFAVSMWRLVIVVLASTGFGLALGAATGSGALAALSQQASLLTAICYLFLLLYPAFTGGRRHEPASPWLRGALVVLLGLVSVTFLTMLGGALDDTWSLFEHLLTPLVVLADWLFVGRDQSGGRWWYPFTWLAFPLAYLLFYIVYVGGGEPIYPFLDPHAGDFVGIVFAFLAAVLGFGFVVFGLGRLKGPPPRR